MSAEKKPESPNAVPAVPKPRPKATWGFACGGAGVPCKTFRIVDGVSRRVEHAELPAPEEDPTMGAGASKEVGLLAENTRA